MRLRLAVVCAVGLSLIAGRLAVGVPSALAGDAASASNSVDPQTVLPPEVIQGAKHETRLRPEEADAYYRALKQARDVDYQTQKQAARRNMQKRRSELPNYRDSDRPLPVFVDLFKNPDRYQGKLVTLEGHVRKLTPMFAGKNDHGITSLYEAWIYTGDSQSNPAVIICTSIPEAMPIGDNIDEPVAVTGFFYKIHVYRARDTTRKAPLLLAQKLEWFPADKFSASPWPGLTLAAGVALLVGWISWLVWRTARNDRTSRAMRLPSEIEGTPDDVFAPDPNLVAGESDHIPTFNNNRQNDHQDHQNDD